MTRTRSTARRRTAALPALATGLAIVLAGSGVAAVGAADWSYSGPHGPDRWAMLDPSFDACGSGQQQSPIDLAGATERGLMPLQFGYLPSAARIVDDGHTVQVDLDPGGSLTLDGVAYQLVQLHFHSPSEHTVDGSSFPVEVHLVHRAESGALAVVGLLVTGGALNPALAPLVSAIPGKVGRQVRLQAPFDASELLPTDRRSYRYTGSLTSPPCTEGVSWVVMAAPIPASGQQIAALARVLQGNSRPPQPRHDRELLLDNPPP